MQVRIRKLSFDEYGYDPPHTDVFVSDGRFSAAADDYIDESLWRSFARRLQAFPANISDEVVFGEVHPEAANSIYLRAFVHDGVGHSALEVDIRRNGSRPYSASSNFCILCEAALLNRLGTELEHWLDTGEIEFDFRR